MLSPLKKGSFFKSFFFNVFIVLILIGVGLVATIYGDSIKYRVLAFVANPQAASVLGDSLPDVGPVPDATKKAEEVGKAIEHGIEEQVEGAKKKALETKVSDVIDFGAKVRKIANDISNIKASIIEKIQELSKRDEESSS